MAHLNSTPPQPPVASLPHLAKGLHSIFQAPDAFRIQDVPLCVWGGKICGQLEILKQQNRNTELVGGFNPVEKY